MHSSRARTPIKSSVVQVDLSRSLGSGIPYRSAEQTASLNYDQNIFLSRIYTPYREGDKVSFSRLYGRSIGGEFDMSRRWHYVFPSRPVRLAYHPVCAFVSGHLFIYSMLQDGKPIIEHSQ